MSNLTPEQSEALADLARAARAYREARDTERARALVEAEKRILAHRVDVDKLAAKAAHLGVKTAQIGREGLGTTDWRSAKSAIERGREFYSPDDDEPVAVEETQDHDGLSANPDGSVRVYHNGAWWAFTYTDDLGVQPEDADDPDTWTDSVVQYVLAPKNTAVREQIKALINS